METTMVYSKIGFFQFDVPVSFEINLESVNFYSGNDKGITSLIITKDDVLCIAHYKIPYDNIELYDDIWLMDVHTFITKKYNLLSDMMVDILRKS